MSARASAESRARSRDALCHSKLIVSLGCHFAELLAETFGLPYADGDGFERQPFFYSSGHHHLANVALRALGAIRLICVIGD